MKNKSAVQPHSFLVLALLSPFMLAAAGCMGDATEPMSDEDEDEDEASEQVDASALLENAPSLASQGACGHTRVATTVDIPDFDTGTTNGHIEFFQDHCNGGYYAETFTYSLERKVKAWIDWYDVDQQQSEEIATTPMINPPGNALSVRTFTVDGNGRWLTACGAVEGPNAYGAACTNWKRLD